MADIEKKPSILVLLILLGVTMISARLGSNYGEHFDESYFVSGLEHSARNHTFLPHRYIYPGMYFNVGYFLLLPDFLPVTLASDNQDKDPTSAEKLASLLARIKDPNFLLEARRAFIMISALAILWVFAADRAWGRSRAESLIGSALLALSWEVNYHSRHIAVDNMLMMSTILSVACLFMSLRRDRATRATLWVLLASVFAGLAAASKMLGFILIIPIVMSVLLFQKNHQRPVGPLFVACISFLSVLASFVAVTPGVILEPARALADWSHETSVYSSGFEPAYTYYAGSIFERITKVTAYFTLDVFSHVSILSAFFAFLIPIGVFSVWKEDKRKSIIFLSFPAIYLAVLLSLRLFIVRNFMVLTPFTAILSARGFSVLYKLTERGRKTRLLLVTPLILLVLVNSYWLFASALTVDRDDMDTTMARLEKYINRHSSQSFVFSKGVYGELREHNPGLSARKTDLASCEDDALLAFFNLEHAQGRWVANRKGYAEKTISSQEVNYDYYPTWHGINLDTRTVIMRVDRARAMNFLGPVYRPPAGGQEPGVRKAAVGKDTDTR